jgi:diketogulonate reductase-like aldo/keto reductase
MKLSLDSTVTIAPGVEMPRFGLGTYKSAPGAETADAVVAALQLGYRAVDTAALYRNEESVGEGLRRSGVARDDVFLTTKVWNEDQGYDETLASLERSLGYLGVERVDLFLVHWPMRAKMAPTWRAMEKALADGMTRAIGVSNFMPNHLEELAAHANVPPAIDQVEFHPYLQLHPLQTYLAEHGIALESWATLMRGGVFDVPELLHIADSHGVTPAQVSLRWALQLGAVVIPKSVHADRIAANARVFDFALTDEEMEIIESLDRGHRLGPDPDRFVW